MKIYRKRYIPKEVVDISSDKIEKITSCTMITTWNTIKPRNDFNRGISWYDFKNGWKISKMYRDDKLLYNYCDIISTEKIGDDYVFTDLIVDLVVHNDGKIEILDMDEMIELFESKEINLDVMEEAIHKLNELIKRVKEIGIENIIKEIEEKE